MAEPDKVESLPVCPRCGSEAVYRYGRTRQGRQRFRCLICERQFSGCRPPPELLERPACRICGRKMHIYSREDTLVRFRCSGYPNCRGYIKLEKEQI